MRKKVKGHKGVFAIGPQGYEILFYWRDPKTGNRHKARRQIEADSAKDAAKEREKLRAELEAGATPAQRTQLRAAVSSWLASKLPAWKPSTRRNTASILDRQVLPVLGDFYLDAITPDDVVAWRDAQTGAPESVNSRLRLLRQVLADVCAPHGLANPAARVPSVRAPLDEANAVYYLDAGEARAVLEWLRDSKSWQQWYPLVLTLALTGLRFGEATALRWTDLDGEWIRVRRAHWKGHVDHPKSRVGVRDVPLAPELAAALEAHKVARKVIAPYVFVGRTGKLHHNSVLSKPIAATLKACAIEGRFPAAHGWRKVHSNLLRQVTDEAVRQALIGHSDADVGVKHYARASDDEKKTAVAKVVRLVTGGG